MLRDMFDPGDWLGMKPALDPSASLLSLEYAPAPAEVKLRIGLGLLVLTAAPSPARDAVEQVRVDTCTGYSNPSDRLGDEGRLTFVGTQFDGGKLEGKLEWVRDYLRFVLARDARPGDGGR